MSWKQWVGVWFLLYLSFAGLFGGSVSIAGFGASVATTLVYAGYRIYHWTKPLWFGTPLWQKYGVLVFVAALLQIIVPLDPVTLLDFAFVPVTAAIWLAVGVAIWRLFQWGRGRLPTRDSGADPAPDPTE